MSLGYAVAHTDQRLFELEIATTFPPRPRSFPHVSSLRPPPASPSLPFQFVQREAWLQVAARTRAARKEEERQHKAEEAKRQAAAAAGLAAAPPADGSDEIDPSRPPLPPPPLTEGPAATAAKPRTRRFLALADWLRRSLAGRRGKFCERKITGYGADTH